MLIKVSIASCVSFVFKSFLSLSAIDVLSISGAHEEIELEHYVDVIGKFNLAF